MIPIFDAPAAPRGLLYLATFSKHERAEIAASPELVAAIRESAPAEWLDIVRQHRETQRTARPELATTTLDEVGLRQQALHDLQSAADALAIADRQSSRTTLWCCLPPRQVRDAQGPLRGGDFRSTS